jgi:hypothetical protein
MKADKNAAVQTHQPNCFECVHFFVTWEPAHPRGCRAFGFKTKQLPSQEVFQASGKSCTLFQARPKPASKN